MRTDENVDESTDSLMKERIIDIKIGCLIRKTQMIRLTYNCVHLRSTLEGGTGWYSVVLGQCGAVLVDI